MNLLCATRLVQAELRRHLQRLQRGKRSQSKEWFLTRGEAVGNSEVARISISSVTHLDRTFVNTGPRDCFAWSAAAGSSCLGVRSPTAGESGGSQLWPPSATRAALLRPAEVFLEVLSANGPLPRASPGGNGILSGETLLTHSVGITRRETGHKTG